MARIPFAVALVAAAVVARQAAADPPKPVTATGVRTYVSTPPETFTPRKAASMISPFVYLNRCTGGCTVNGSASVNDARTQTSTIPSGNGPFTITEFANGFAQTGTSGMGTCLDPTGTMTTTTCTNDAGCTSLGAGSLCDTADYEWNLLVKCMKEVYSPYNVTLQDTPPGGGVSYTEAIIGGVPSNIGLGGGILGIAPLAGDCSAQDNVISFSFANAHGGYGPNRVYNMCWTAAQETAHAFGLDHEYQFVSAYTANQNSACMDPMTYRTDCGGEKFFRDATAYCGEFQKRDCRCGGTQNSHQRILAVFGAGTPITTPPMISITQPMDGATIAANAAVQSTGGSQRGILVLQLALNGYVWVSGAGGAYGQNGQAYGAQQALVFPNGVPNSIIDIVVKAYDDLNVETDSATVTVTLGAPCQDASTCAKGQQCQAGKCFWPPPTGNLGDSCTYDQFCMSDKCLATTDGMFCTQTCLLGVADVCPTGYDCVMGTDPNNGFCVKTGKGGGCCSASGDNGVLAHFALGAGVLGFAMRRRRRRS